MEIENENEMPYGMLHNDFEYGMIIDGKKYKNVSEYLYVNLFRFVLYNYGEKLKICKLKEPMWLEMSIKNPESLMIKKNKSMYENFEESLKKFGREIMSHHYTKMFTEKLLNDDTLLVKFLSLKAKEFVYRDEKDSILGLNSNNEGANMIGIILRNIHNLFTSQNMFLLIFKPYIVYSILKYYLTVEMNDFQLLKSYVDIGRIVSTSKGEVDLMKKIIDEYQETRNIKNLKLFDFEKEIQNDEEFSSILISSIKDPIVIIEYTIYKYFDVLLYRMTEFRKKIVLNVYIQQSFVGNVEEVENELKSVNVSMLSDTLFSLYINRSLPIEIQNMLDVELGKYVFVSNFNKKFSEEILSEKEEEIKNADNKVYDFDSNVKFIKESVVKLNTLFSSDMDLNGIKKMLLRIGLTNKFQILNPKIEIKEKLFESHLLKTIDSNDEISKRHSKDLQHLLKTIKNFNDIKYEDKDEFVKSFMEEYLKSLSKIVEVEKYDWKESLNEFVEKDLFMSQWLMKTSKYVINLINILFDYNNEEDKLEFLEKILICLGESDEFLSVKLKRPSYFDVLIEEEMKFLKEEDSGIIFDKTMDLIWKFVMSNVVILYENKKKFFGTNYQSKIKDILIFFYINLQKNRKCIIEFTEENKEYHLISCIVNASFNILKILYMLKLNDVKNKAMLISSLMLNKKIECYVKGSKNLEEEKEDIIQSIIESNDLDGINVGEMKKIVNIVENEKISNILKLSRINFFLNLKV